jgi:hypothetical protein
MTGSSPLTAVPSGPGPAAQFDSDGVPDITVEDERLLPARVESGERGHGVPCVVKGEAAGRSRRRIQAAWLSARIWFRGRTLSPGDITGSWHGRRCAA